MTEADTSPTPTPPPRRPDGFGPIVLGGVLVLVGGLWLLDAVEVIDVRAAVVLPAVLAVVGVALIVGSFDGPHSGLVTLGVFLTVAVVMAAVFPANPFGGGLGQRVYRVSDAADLESGYGVGLGELELDLGDLALSEPAHVDVTVGAGEMRVVLPAGGEVRVDASAGAGEIDLLGETADGVSVSRTYTSSGYDDSGSALTLDLNVGAGEIEVTR